jgi:multidrug efflux pump
MHATRQRVRPILMTSLAFMAGVLPLAISSGAGSGAQHAVGTGVIGGMLASTFLAVFFVPVFFVVIRSFFKGSTRQQEIYEHHADSAGIAKEEIK